MNIVTIQSDEGEDKIILAVPHIVAVEKMPDKKCVVVFLTEKTLRLDTDDPNEMFQCIKAAMIKD